ncbi:MAG: Serine/threonine-protein kinase pknE [Actinomycetota bacterium]
MSIPDSPVPGQDVAGTARMRRQVGRLRSLAIVAVVLVVILGVWSVIGIVTLSSQVSSLEAKVDSLATTTGALNSSSGGSAASGAQSPPSPSAVPDSPASAPADVVVPAGADKAGAIVVGDPEAAKFVEVYVDYQCPYCQRWETEIGAALMERALQPGSGLAVRQYNMAFLGEANRSLSPPAASARAANAAACVLDGDGVEAFVAFNTAVFAAPGGQDAATRFDTASLVALASGVGAGDATLTCIEDEAFMPFVAATTQAAFARGVTGTPTVLVNGKVIADSFGDAQLLSLLTM